MVSSFPAQRQPKLPGRRWTRLRLLRTRRRKSPVGNTYPISQELAVDLSTAPQPTFSQRFGNKLH